MQQSTPCGSVETLLRDDRHPVGIVRDEPESKLPVLRTNQPRQEALTHKPLDHAEHRLVLTPLMIKTTRETPPHLLPIQPSSPSHRNTHIPWRNDRVAHQLLLHIPRELSTLYPLSATTTTPGIGEAFSSTGLKSTTSCLASLPALKPQTSCDPSPTASVHLT